MSARIQVKNSLVTTEQPVPSTIALKSSEVEARQFGSVVNHESEPNPVLRVKVWARIILIVVPIVISTIYLFLIASDRYLSEADFLIRSTTVSAASEITSLVQSQALARAADESYVVKDYLLSRDAMQRLVAKHDLLAILRRPEADIFNRFPSFIGRADDLALFRRYRDMVGVKVDESTGIVSLRVVAFRADDARAIATALIADAEAFLNRMNGRAEQDAVAYAQAFVDEARGRVRDVERRISDFRNVNGSADPNQEAARGLDAIAALTHQAAEMRADLDQQSAMTPSSPALASRRQQIDALETQIQAQKEKIVGTSSSLSSRLGDFEQLVVEREIAARGLATAMSNLDKTLQEATQKHLYLQEVVSPNLPDRAEYPRRLLDILITLVVGLGLYIIIVSLYSAVMEHRP